VKTYIAQRLGIAVLTLFGMSVVISVLLRLAPGDIVDVLFSAAGSVNPSEKEAILRELGLDKPYWRQYLDWVGQIFTGDLGKSYRYDLPAWQIIRPLVPVTVELAILATIVSVLIGVPTGIVSAVQQDTALDDATRVVSLAGLSMPSFWLGMVIILALMSWLAWIPPLTYVSPRENLWLHAVQFLLPALAVGLGAAILTEAALSFLGLGVPEPYPSWGRMLSVSAAEYAQKAPHLVLFPGIAISLAVFGSSLSGDALRDTLDPRLRGA
jgi:peptide/nickel transport system permease protein